MNNNFKDIYYKIYNENQVSSVEKIGFKRSMNILKLFGITMLGAIVHPITLIITIPILIIYATVSSSKKRIENENNLYKEKLILPLLQEIYNDMQYRPKEVLELDKYLEAEYNDKITQIDDIDKYSSGDHIILPIKIEEKNIGNLDIYNVKLETPNVGTGHGNNRLKIFEGLTATISLLKNIQTKIKLSPKVITNIIDFPDNNNVVPTDSSEFNNYFKILADNPNLAMSIFSPDILSKMIIILKTNKQIFSVNMINDKLYIRVSCSSAFEPVIVLKQEKHTHVEKTFNALELMKELAYLFYKIIDVIDIT